MFSVTSNSWNTMTWLIVLIKHLTKSLMLSSKILKYD